MMSGGSCVWENGRCTAKWGREVFAILQNVHFCYRWLVVYARARMYIFIKVYFSMMYIHVRYMATFLYCLRFHDTLDAGWIYGSNGGLYVC